MPRPSSCDQRLGGTWTAAQAAKNHLLYVMARAVLGALHLIPSGALRQLGRALGKALHTLHLGRATADENLARVYPLLTPRDRRLMAARTYAELGGYLGETVAQLYRPGELVTIPFEEGSRQVLEEALHQGGVVFASAHLGPWERVAGSLVRHGFALTTLARESYDPRFLPLYERLRRSVGVQAIYRGQPRAPLQIVRALRRGDLLGVPMDLRSRVPSVRALFLGAPAETAAGPATIALRTRAPVVVGTAMPGPAGDLVLRMTRISTGDLRADPKGVSELTQRLNDELGRRILGFSHGWVWMHPRWATGVRENSAPSSKETRYSSRSLVDELR